MNGQEFSAGAAASGTGAADGFRPRFLEQLSHMAPANFAMVMSTGIVAIALAGTGFTAAGKFFWLLCGGLWLVNALLLLARLALFPGRVVDDLLNPLRSCGLLTFVAGTNVWGSASVIIPRFDALGVALFWIGLIAWLFLVTAVWCAMCLTPKKMPVEKSLNGTWLLFTVSSQSIVVLGSLLDAGAATAPAAFCLFLLFLLGEAFYFLIMPVILYRLMFKELEPAELSATFWINAGAMAITCLAGVRLAPVLASLPELADLAPLVKALAAGAWAIASFWVPCLVALGVWRHGLRRYPLQYGVEYWSMVFPLGMYTACTLGVHGLFPFSGLTLIAHIFLACALAAWLAVFVGLCRNLWKDLAGAV